MAAWAASLGKGWRSALLATGTADPPDEASVVKALEAGADVVFHAGHGHEHGWDQSVGVKSIVKFPKSPRLPVVLSAGCSTARFTVLPPYEPYLDASFAEHKGTNAGEVFADPPPAPFVYQGGLYSRDGFGEALLRAPAGGAVAYFGCNTGSQPCGLTLLEGFVQGLTRAAGADARLGDLWRGAVDHYVEKERLFDLKPDAGWYPPSIFFQGMKFMLFGDPALRVATAAPPGPASRPARP
jgi:hypothetical protein